mmetsp:Transcript_39433/g.126384  ORF Transcript_39433/g.126384 Transcript_39433/m.126384 type:complete len:271 (+) Transcript_39433:143-955(+)
MASTTCSSQNFAHTQDEEATPPSTPDVKGAGQDRGISPTTCAPSDRSLSEAPDAASDSEPDLEHRFTKDETLLIFDWDDTVLASSWIQENNIRLDGEWVIPTRLAAEFSKLAKLAAETLRRAKKLGTVVLVTNAERGWIELSCQRFLPELLPCLESVKILSARSEYERPDLPSPFEWKLRAFAAELGRFFNPARPACPARKNVISIGDSAHEREAVLRVTACMRNCRVKSLKFVERPSIDQICRQQEFLATCFTRLVHHDGNLDLSVDAF